MFHICASSCVQMCVNIHVDVRVGFNLKCHSSSTIPDFLDKVSHWPEAPQELTPCVCLPSTNIHVTAGVPMGTRDHTPATMHVQQTRKQ